jgi:hypothetical protein
MKMLFSFSKIEDVAAVKSLLTQADIRSQIINDAMSPAMIELALYPELWIEQDDDFLAASVLLASWRRKLPQPVIAPAPAAPKMLEISPL